ncbi:hypothetical protein EVAR_26064_1 [Eumeta japonica]|uniref:Reverse transcriptase domain-containing protein n=1 Tax=Eumeta variegata TaxID=151549 RepID=A0A4C1VQN8_EUMVA|nr:hypothetical protein EVAR_26064_1 [Eumeta japonica]
MDELFVKWLLYADTQVKPLVCEFQAIVNKMNESIIKRGMKVNVSKTEVMLLKKAKVRLNAIDMEGERVEQVKEFVYFDSLFTNDGKYDRDIETRVYAKNKMNGASLAIIISKSVSRQAH